MEMVREEVEEIKKIIERKSRERTLLNSDVVSAEETERKKKEELLAKDNELRKIENKHTAYTEEIQRLNKQNAKLEKEKEKYGMEASQANGKYYQCLEQVRLKKNLIAKLQKKNIEAEALMKWQFNMYEMVRSDRNLYSKNLLDAVEELTDLKTKFKRMAGTIINLKDEL